MPTPQPRSRGFSLIEMLVVIGIIVILIGVLIPVIKSVRENAWNADTQNLISQIVSASTRYYQDFNAYPGVFSNTEIVQAGRWVDFDTGTNKGTIETPSPGGDDEHPITMAENLTLSLLGGLRWNGSTYEYDLSSSLQAQGPVSLNAANPKRYPAYMNVREGNISEGYLSKDSRNPQPGVEDTVIPEFMDTWPDGSKRPIIYVRARSGAGGAVSDFRNDQPAAGSHFQYDVGQYEGYLTTKDGLRFTRGDQTGSDAPEIAFDYLKHPNSGGTATGQGAAYPLEKDRFLLFAAGKDRIFGTSDDIVSAGGGQ
jgi:prepilin-type N-terminal cleavage/methylation domain-containing protein